MSEEPPTQDPVPGQQTSTEPPPFKPDHSLITYLEKGRDPEGTKIIDPPPDADNP